MNFCRNYFLFSARIFICLLQILALGCSAKTSRAEPHARPRLVSVTPPNIIFILTDDLDYASLTYLPKVKAKLADHGITFTQFYVNNSLCCPSRACILRGQYVHSHGILDNSAPLGGFKKFVSSGDEQSTIATWLKDAGYTTGLIGKYLNDYPTIKDREYVPFGWDYWAAPIGNAAYTGYNYTLNENGKLIDFGDTEADYFTDVMSARAAQFVQSSLDQKKPFFLYLAPFVPHQPSVPAPRHRNLFNGVKVPRSDSYDQDNVSEMPQYIRQLKHFSKRIAKLLDRILQRRLQSLQAVDDMVETLTTLLEERGAIDNTYIIFTSDNGYHLGQHRLPPGKKTPYDEDIHVPLVIRGPGVEAATQSNLLSAEVDLGPTILELAGGTTPAFVEGRSFVSVLSDPKSTPQNWRQSVLIEHYSSEDEPFESFDKLRRHRKNRSDPVPGYFALRTESTLYVHYETGERELYQTKSDPLEIHNLASEQSLSVEHYESWLNRFKECKGANCRSADRDLP